MLQSYDYNMHAEGLSPANLCFVTLLNSEHCSQFERFRLQHGTQNIQFQNKIDCQ